MTMIKFSSPPPCIPPGHARVGAFHAVPEVIRNLGGSVEAVLAPLRLTEKFLTRPDNVLPISTLGELLYRAADATACEHFGLLAGSHAGVGHIGAPGQLMLRFPTVGTSLEAIQRFFHLHNRSAIIVLRRTGDHAHFGYSLLSPNFPGFQELQDGVMAAGLNIMRRLLGDAWRPTGVNLVRREPRRADIYDRFFGAPCVFNAMLSTLVFPATTLDLPVLESTSAGVPEHRATMPNATDMDLIEHVRRTALGLLLSGKCSQQTVAAALGYSTRTLNRNLALFGSSYREIADYSRFAASRMLIRETDMPLGEVARLLNYADMSSFGRAFRRWTGISPTTWRKHLARPERRKKA